MSVTTLETLEIQFKTGMAGVKAELTSLKSQLQGIDSTAVKTKTSFGGMGTAIKAFIGLAAVREMWKVGKASLGMANDVVESENLFAVSMKGMADETRAWSEDLQSSLGLNAYTLRKNAGTFNTMFSSMGFGTQAAYDMSTGLTELAEDMASFYNLKSEDAFDKLRAGITGEAEPLKRLGILIDENTVKQYAYANGIAETGKDLTATEKVQARYLAILAQTANAQGDLARTIDSPVNQIRQLNNILDQAKVALGQAFQPIQAVALPILRGFASGLLFVGQAFNTFMRQMTGFSSFNALSALSANKSSKAQDGLAESLNDTAKALKKSGGAAKQAAKDGKVGLKAFDEINKLADETTNAGGGGKQDEIDVPDTTEAEGYAGLMETISRNVQAAADAIRAFWDGLKNSVAADVVRGAGDAIAWLWDNAISPMGEWLLAHPTTVADGLLAIGVAVAVWTVGTNYEIWLTGIATGLKAIGTTIATHPVLFTLAVLAGGLVLVTSAIKQANEEAKAEDLASRFGTLALSMEELKAIADTITTPFATAAACLVADFDKLRQSVANLQGTITANNKLVYAYSITAMPLSADQKTALVASVQAQVDQGMKTLEGAQVTASMSLEALFKGSGVDGSEVVALNKENWAKVKQQASDLGAELQKAISDALTDGTITEEEQAGISELQAKYAQMISQATDPDVIIAQAQVRRLGIDFSKAELTPETIKNFNETLNTRKAEILASIDTTGQLAIDYVVGIAIQANPSISDEKLAKVKDAAELALASQRLTAEMEVEKVRITGVVGQVKKAYGDALAKSGPAIKILSKDWVKEAYNQLLNSGWSEADLDTTAGQTAIGLKAEAMLRSAMEGIDLPEDATQATIRDFLNDLRPNYEQWKVLADEYRKKGLAVPVALQEGINTFEALESVSMATGGLATVILNQMSGLPNKFAEYGTNAANAFAGGLGSSSSISAAIKAAERLANAGKNAFKKGMEISSPSKVFKYFGRMTGIAPALGMEEMIPRVTKASEALAGAIYDPVAAINTDLLKGGSYSVSTEATQRMQVGYEDQAAIMSGYIQQAVAGAVAQVLDKLNIQINVDGETWARGTAKTINDTTRRDGKLLLDF
jgi:hypothetical protein